MNFNKVMLATVIAMSSVSFVQAASNQGGGSVTFNGKIIDAPCSLDAGSLDQSIDMGQISNRALANQGKSASVPFSIALKDCEVATLKTVKVAFTGQKDANNTALLGLSGTASGAGIQLVDGNSNKIVLDGTQDIGTTLMNGANTLSFSAYLQGSAAATPVVPGDFSAVTNFTVAYQ